MINIALNLVKGDNLAWQQRKAQSFTISPLHSGSWNLGVSSFRRIWSQPPIGQPLSLGTALAISGTAASPNMGYHSSSAVTFPSGPLQYSPRLVAGQSRTSPGMTTYHQASPTLSIRPLLAEAFRLTDACHPYVYLSDGGHFENLGLYEMVRRRCHCIPCRGCRLRPRLAFEDFGNAIRKIRIDLGIDIEIALDQITRSADTGTSARHHAIGTIRYDKVDDNATAGTLVYLKPSLTGSEPTDVQDYAARHPAFPTSRPPISSSTRRNSNLSTPRGACRPTGLATGTPTTRAGVFTPLSCAALPLDDDPIGHAGVFPGRNGRSQRPRTTVAGRSGLAALRSGDVPGALLRVWMDPGTITANPRAALHTCNLQIQLMEQVYLAVRLENSTGTR